MMPDPSKMMIVRPKNCHYCGHGFYGLAHVVQYAQSQGYAVIDMPETQANKDPIYTELNVQDPGLFYGFGHGDVCRYTGDSEEDIFTCNDNSILSERMVYLLSCLTANALGPAIIKNGATYYAGYNISWTWLSESGTEGDPYDDIYALGFWESANELWMSICDGLSFSAAVYRCIDMYNQWIEYWLYENPEDPSSEDCIMWLIHDRNGLVALSQAGPIRPGTMQLNWGLAVPILAVVALALITFKR